MKAALPFLATLELLKLLILASLVFALVDQALWASAPALITAFLAAFSLGRVLRAVKAASRIRGISHAIGISAGLVLFLAPGLSTGGAAPRLSSLLPAAACLTAFWLRAAWLVAKARSAAFILLRFEEGLVVFLATLLIAALSGLDLPGAEYLTLPYFLSGLLALGLSRRAGDPSRQAVPAQRRGRGSLVIAVLLFTVAALGLLVFFPALTAPLHAASRVLGPRAAALGSWLLSLLSSIYTYGRAAPSKRAVTDGLISPEGGPEGEIAAASSAGDLIVLVLAILAVMACAAFVFLIIRDLRSRSARAKAGTAARLDLFALGARLSALGARISAFVAALRWSIRQLLRAGVAVPDPATTPQARRKRSAATRAYARLLVRGRLVGLPRRQVETAREYSCRLLREFPQAARGAEEIVGTYEREIFGEQVQDEAGELRSEELRRSLTRRAFAAELLLRVLRRRLRVLRRRLRVLRRRLRVLRRRRE